MRVTEKTDKCENWELQPDDTVMTNNNILWPHVFMTHLSWTPIS
jgi:hypothetical protein